MPFDPKDFLQLATDLVNDANYNHESAFRTSISRAYYSAFLVCRTWLETTHGFSFPRTADPHRLVTQRLRNRTVLRTLLPGRMAVADILKTIRRRGRNVADYDLLAQVRKADAMSWIQFANYVIDSIP